MINKVEHILLLVLVFLFAVFLLNVLTGCAGQQNRREQLQREHPDCHVFEDLLIECPNPFANNAGFGTEVRVIKTPLIIRQPKKAKKK